MVVQKVKRESLELMEEMYVNNYLMWQSCEDMWLCIAYLNVSHVTVILQAHDLWFWHSQLVIGVIW